MVHALDEAWRVLVPQGTMVDLRPLCLDAPVDVRYREKNEFAGIIDMSPDIADEIAADKAVKGVVSGGLFAELSVERFEIAYYWKTVKGMMAELHTRWMDDIIIDESVIRNAYELFARHRGDKKVRIRLQMKLAKYGKR
jgi:hypothetical protein